MVSTGAQSLIGNPVIFRSGPAAVVPIPVSGISAFAGKRHCSYLDGKAGIRSGEPEDLPVTA
jgi:hypothetical protein